MAFASGKAHWLGFLTSLFWTVLPAGAQAPAGEHTLNGPVALAWESRFSPGVDSGPRALAVSPDGRAVYVGVQVGFSSPQCRLSARDAASGAELWGVSPAGVVDCIPWWIAVSRDGNVVYLASLAGTDRVFVYGTHLAAYDAATGAGLWSVLYDGPGDQGFSVADLELSPDGSRLSLAGNLDPRISSTRAAAFDAATGALLWEAAYPSPSIYGDQASALAVAPGGGTIYLTGYIQSGDDKDDFLTLSYDAATGAQLWEARYAGAPDARHRAVDVAVSPGGTAVFVTGGPITAAYDAATGAELWAAGVDIPVDGYISLAALAISRDGGTVFVSGTSIAPDEADILILAYDAGTGARKWISRIDRETRENAVAMTLSPSGGALFVTGYMYSGLPYDPDFLTIGVSAAEGAELWSARYQGTGRRQDIPNALAVSPQGDTLFVTGSSVGTRFDTVTLAYSLPQAGGGFLAGGGWLDSPAGALPAQPALTGKAHLTVIARSLPKKTAPSGSMSFRFGPLHFRSRSYDVLTVSGGRAVLRGRGTLQGRTGEHRFLLSVLGDRVRVKIWHAPTGVIVYDSQPGAPDDAAPAAPLGGGSIAFRP